MILHGDCLEVMRGMDANSVDAIVTDPPYGLEFMGKEWDKFGGKPVGEGYNGNGGMKRYFKGNKPIYKWDMIAFQEFMFNFAVEALRVAKPGAHLLAFGGTRTFHRLACAIEDAGWEIRDCLGWLYGSGFPKSHDVSKAIDKAAGAEREVIGRYRAATQTNNCGTSFNASGADEHGRTMASITAPATDAAREWEGWGTALKPAWEPIIMARKPLDGTVAANVQKWGTGAINVDGCRVPTNGEDLSVEREPRPLDTQKAGWGFKSVSRGNQGRWPANLIHDGSDEVMELFPSPHGAGCARAAIRKCKPSGRLWKMPGDGQRHGDSGSAARFFYCAKASRKEREMGCEGMEARHSSETQSMPTNQKCATCGGWKTTGNADKRCSCAVPDYVNTPARNHHPTVKPLALMRYLCRLVTPPNGLILDPFMGSGTTLIAAEQEGFRAVGIEVSEEYCEIAKRRVGYAERQAEATA